jgi:hypothetical protein
VVELLVVVQGWGLLRCWSLLIVSEGRELILGNLLLLRNWINSV